MEYKGVVESKSYGNNVAIKKKEYSAHVFKRMGMWLRYCKQMQKPI